MGVGDSKLVNVHQMHTIIHVYNKDVPLQGVQAFGVWGDRGE